MDYNSLPNFYAALDAKYNVTNNECYVHKC